MFRALALCQSIWIRSDEGLTLETPAVESLYGGQFTLSTQLIKPNYLVILPPMQHHSFFRNLPRLKEKQTVTKAKSLFYGGGGGLENIQKIPRIFATKIQWAGVVQIVQS